MEILALSPDDRSLLPRHSMSFEIPGDAPSDEEAQDALEIRKHPHFFILTTPTTPTTAGTGTTSRRRTQSLHSVLPEHLLHHRTRHYSNGYDSYPSDLSSEASDDESHSHVPVPEQREPVISHSQRRRQWAFRVILLLCAYVSWTTDSLSFSNSLLLRSTRSPQTTAAFSPQHGREVALPVEFPKSPLTEIKKVYIPPPRNDAPNKRRPNLSHALPGNAPPVLGQKPLQRFILDENDVPEDPLPPLPPRKKKSSLQWVASIALFWLVLETGLRQVRPTLVPPLALCFTPRQRLRYD